MKEYRTAGEVAYRERMERRERREAQRAASGKRRSNPRDMEQLRFLATETLRCIAQNDPVMAQWHAERIRDWLDISRETGT